MDIRFKVEITLDKDKIIDEQKYLVKTVEDVIRNVFTDKGIVDRSDDDTLIFCTDDHDLFGKVLVSVNTVYFSNAQKYLKSIWWYNYEDMSKEDVLSTFRKAGA